MELGLFCAIILYESNMIWSCRWLERVDKVSEVYSSGLAGILMRHAFVYNIQLKANLIKVLGFTSSSFGVPPGLGTWVWQGNVKGSHLHS